MKARVKKEKKRTDDLFLFRLCNRATLFLVLAQAVSLLLYVSGNYQGFMDATLQFILRWCVIVSILVIPFSVAGIVQSVVFFFVSFRARYWGFFALYLLSLIVSPVVFVLFSAVDLLSGGL